MPKGKPYAYDGATKKKSVKVGKASTGKHATVKVPKMPMMKKPGMMRGY